MPGAEFDAALTLLVLAVTLAGMVREYLAPDILMLAAVGVLTAAGVVDVEAALSGFANPTLLTLGALFVVAAALRSTGVLRRVADQLLGATDSLRPVLARLTSVTAVGSAFLNNTPIVAMGIPAVMSWAKERGISPAKLLMPLSFASIFGGLCTLIGTSTNLVADGLLRSHGLGGLGFFELAWVGVPCAVAGIAYLVVVAPNLLGEREDIRTRQEAQREKRIEMELGAVSPLVGRSAEEAGLDRIPGLPLVGISRRSGREHHVELRDELSAGDRVTFEGELEEALRSGTELGLTLVPPEERESDVEGAEAPEFREAVIPEGSPLVGETVQSVEFPARYGARVTEVRRHDEVLDDWRTTPLHPGDTLLLEAEPGFTRTFEDAGEFYLVGGEQRERFTGEEADEEARKHMVPRERALSQRVQRRLSVAVLVGIVAFATSGFVHISVAALIGAIVVIALGIITPGDARCAIDWSVLLVIGAALGLDPRPFVIAITVTASLALATPLGYQTNLMVYGPGGYRFGDFLRVGLPLQLGLGALAVFMAQLVWPL